MTDSQKRLREAAEKAKREIEAAYRSSDIGYGERLEFQRLANPSAILELLAELERAEVDAALVLSAPTADTVNAGSYLYLRDCCDDNPAGPIVCQGTDDVVEFLRGAELDAAIAAARKD